LIRNQRFTFPVGDRWRFWQRRIATAQVLAVDESTSIVHLRIADAGPCFIAHLPILERCAPRGGRFRAQATPWRKQEGISIDAIARWREAHRMEEAGAFAVPLREAIALIYETAPDLTDEMYIESAYPVRDETGVLRMVRVITAPVT